MIKLATIIPALNEENAIDEFSLHSLVEQTFQEDLPVSDKFPVIVVIDRETKDITKEVAESYSDRLKIRVVDQPADMIGPGGARNYGMRVSGMSGNDICVFLDADVIASKNALEIIYGTLSKWNYVGLCCPIYLKTDVSFYRFAYQIGNLRAIVTTIPGRPEKDENGNAAYANYKPKVTGNLVAYRAGPLKEVGGWTESKETGEDHTTAERIGEKGRIPYDRRFYGLASDRRLRGWGLSRSLFTIVYAFYKQALGESLDLSYKGVDKNKKRELNYAPVRI